MPGLASVCWPPVRCCSLAYFQCPFLFPSKSVIIMLLFAPPAGRFFFCFCVRLFGSDTFIIVFWHESHFSPVGWNCITMGAKLFQQNSKTKKPTPTTTTTTICLTVPSNAATILFRSSLAQLRVSQCVCLRPRPYYSCVSPATSDRHQTIIRSPPRSNVRFAEKCFLPERANKYDISFAFLSPP